MVQNPKVRVHLDDARHFLLTTKEKFDAVTSDPLDPWVKGAATLYTREFFETVKEHLNPGGVVTLFVQLYESSDAAVKSEVATFLEAFPTAWCSPIPQRPGVDLVLVGQLNPGPINVAGCRRVWRTRPTRQWHGPCRRLDQFGGGTVWHLRRPQGRHGGWLAAPRSIVTAAFVSSTSRAWA